MSAAGGWHEALQGTAQRSAGRGVRSRRDSRARAGPGQVRVRVAAGSLNFNDIDRCHGRVTTIPMPPPFTLGMDVCGVVDAAGAGGEAWIGRRVVAITQIAQGGLAEYALAPLTTVFDAPDGLDDAEAAAFLLPFHTAHLALFRRGRLEAGETLLVHAGASGLGSAAIQLGVAKGARVLATAGSAAKTKLCTRARRRARDRPHPAGLRRRRARSHARTSARTSSAISPAATSSRSRGAASRARVATSASASPTTRRTA